MIIEKSEIPEVLIIKPKVYNDFRGFFYESFNERLWHEKTRLKKHFVQYNRSQSKKDVLRGLHYQIKHPQGKLIQVFDGTIFDVAVDLRKSSSTFGKWIGLTLSSDSKHLIWIPEGFAHGFQVLSKKVDVLYMTTDFFEPQFERTLLWNDPHLNIKWPNAFDPIISTKDKNGSLLRESDYYS